MTKGKLPMCEKVLNRQFIKAIRDGEKDIWEKLLENPDISFIQLHELTMRWIDSGTIRNRVVLVDSEGEHDLDTEKK